jgi:hypothetical protein
MRVVIITTTLTATLLGLKTFGTIMAVVIGLVWNMF